MKPATAANSHSTTPALLRGGRIGRIGKRVVSYAPLVGLAFAASAGDARAANECGTATAGAILTCTNPSYPAGIAYSGVNGLTLNLDNSAMTVANPGVSVGGTSTGNITVNGTSFSTITTSANSTSGINASTNGTGSVNATLGSGAGSISTSGTFSYGALANANSSGTGAGNAAATMAGGSIATTGANAHGVASITNGNGNATTTLTNGTINVSAASAAGLFAQVSGASTSSSPRVQMDGGTITSGGQGIYVLDNSAAGSAAINITAGTITSSSTGAYLLANAGTNSTSSISLSGTGQVTTSGTGASGLSLLNQGIGSNTITISGGNISTQSTSGTAGSHGAVSNISSATNAAASTIVMNNASIATSGGISHGLFAQTTGTGASTITIGSGTISTAGSGSYGVSSAINNNASSSNSQVVLQNGTITTTGSGGRGISATTNTSGTANVTIQNGSVTTGNLNGFGAYTANTGTSSTGAATISMQAGNIQTGGSTGHGLYVENGARGTTSISLTGGSVSTTGSGANGLFASGTSATNSSAVSVLVQGGTISATGASSIGARANSSGSSGATGTMTSGSITSAGSGLMAYTSSANGGRAATSLSGGTITTNGSTAVGLYAWADGATNTGASSATMTGGSIVGNGATAVGVQSESRGTGSASAVVSGGTVRMLDTASVTYGVRSRIFNSNNSASTSVLLQGTASIETRGGISHALIAETTGRGSATATIDSGTISTSGANTYGAFSLVGSAASSANATTIMNGGTITASGSGSAGIVSQNSGAGIATTTMANGLITAAGNSSKGLIAYNYGLGAANVGMTGGTINLGTAGVTENAIGLLSSVSNVGSSSTATATLEGGTINILGNRGTGIQAFSVGKGNVLASIVGGTVTTQGDGLPAARAWIFTAPSFPPAPNSSTALALMSMSGGLVQTAGADAIGIQARTEALGGGATAALSGGSITTGGSGAYAVHAQVDNALSIALATATMGGGTVTTTGANASGLRAQTNGLGTADVWIDTASITTSGASAHGAHAFIDNAANSNLVRVVMNGGTITTSADGASGLRSETLGTGTYGAYLLGGTVTTQGNQAYGIHTIGSDTGAIYVGRSAVINAAGGVAIRDGDAGTDTRGGKASVYLAGTVNGGVQLGLGNDELELVAGSLTGNIYGDDVAAQAADGNDTFLWTGGAFTGSFFGGGGSDVGYVTATGYNSTQGFHGGADPGADTLTFDGVRSATLNGDVTGWEQTTITNGSVIGLKGTAANDLGSMDIASGSALIAYEGLVLKGNVNAAGLIDLSGTTLPAMFSASPSAELAAAMAASGTGPGVPGTELVAGGTFTGGGAAILDVNLGEAQLLSADRLMIGGDVTGHTTLYMNNTTPGLGSETTGDGILLVDVGGTASSDAFSLASGPITSGAFVYDLDFGGKNNDNNNFYLVSSLTPEAATYQALPYLIATTFTDLPGLVKRRAGRVPVGQSNGTVADGPLESHTGGWAQIEGGRNKAETTDDSRFSTDHWSLKAGYDADAGIPFPGKLIVGGYVTYANASDTVDSNYGSGSISSDAIGAGLTATYYSDGGSYVDLQGRVMGIKSDLDEVSDIISTAAVGSAELGHVFALGSSLSLVPSAQLQYGGSSASSFVDGLGNEVSDLNYDGFTGRLGAALQAALGASPESGPLLTASLDWIHDFSPEVGVIVDGADIDTDLPENWLEAGLSVDWRVGETSLLELRANYAVAPGQDIADNSSLGASANFRLGF